jgi:hypothetical protein
MLVYAEEAVAVSQFAEGEQGPTDIVAPFFEPVILAIREAGIQVERYTRDRDPRTADVDGDTPELAQEAFGCLVRGQGAREPRAMPESCVVTACFSARP